ncbi:glutathione-dependent formaldehyde-activating protein [Endogone sp. FLAS-F59071]|nr:glutathione-dependent formaldehyde-activating protein [Endogone sp. FLAS-F59071]|eukprot:RUS18330.1 glutathione-dependent formaldehyde-activating protein [Endogone sp. FLAS-F59071]
MSSNPALVTHSGSCHCGRVQFECQAPAEDAEVHDCNCSICAKKGFLHLIVPKSRFRVLSGEDALTCYTFNTHVAKHFFCKYCGISPYYIPRSHPDGIDVNYRCIDSKTFKSVRVEPFDGKNWEQSVKSTAPLPED